MPLRLLRAGGWRDLRRPTEDTLQLGGDFVIAPDGSRTENVYDELSRRVATVDQEGKLKIGKLNVDEAADVARRFEVMSIPTLIVFKDGAPAKRIVGAKGKAALLQDLEEFL